jgi:hypothetical protein
MSYSESPIDERYRLMLLEHYLDGAIEAPYRGFKKWSFVCPFCASLSSREYKKREKKGSLLWDSRQHSWVFFCKKNGSADCMNGKKKHQAVFKNPNLQGNLSGFGYQCAPKNSSREVFQGEKWGEQ